MKRQRLPELKLFIRFDSVKSTQTMHISYSCSVLSQNASFQRYFPILRKKINRKIAFRVLHQNPSKHTNFIELSIIRVHCSWIHFHFSCVDTTTFLRHQTHEKKQFWSFVYSQSACFCISFFLLVSDCSRFIYRNHSILRIIDQMSIPVLLSVDREKRVAR